MEQKVAQYLNKDKDTGNVLEKCFENLYNSLEQDISLICSSFAKERTDNKQEISDKPEAKPEDISEKPAIPMVLESIGQEVQDTNNFEKIKKRIDLTINLLVELNNLDQSGTNYLGDGSTFMKN